MPDEDSVLLSNEELHQKNRKASLDGDLESIPGNLDRRSVTESKPGNRKPLIER
jgi:hypothetical protein